MKPKSTDKAIPRGEGTLKVNRTSLSPVETEMMGSAKQYYVSHNTPSPNLGEDIVRASWKLEEYVEEFLQLLTFAAFSYTSCDDWSGLQDHIVIMKQGHRMARFFIRYFGVLCPLMWVPYLEYVKANEQYIKTMERRIQKEQQKGRWNNR